MMMFQGGFGPRFFAPLGRAILIIINIIGGIHTCRTVWAQLVNHTMKQLQPTLDLYYQSKRW